MSVILKPVLALLAAYTARENNLRLEVSQMSAMSLKLTRGGGLSHPPILRSMHEVSVCMYVASLKG